MTEAIIAAIITGVITLLVCIINNHYQSKKAEEKHTETISLIAYKLDQLTRKVELHNNAVERLYEVEKRLGIDEEKIASNKRRINDLEHSHK